MYSTLLLWSVSLNAPSLSYHSLDSSSYQSPPLHFSLLSMSLRSYTRRTGGRPSSSGNENAVVKEPEVFSGRMKRSVEQRRVAFGDLSNAERGPVPSSAPRGSPKSPRPAAQPSYLSLVKEVDKADASDPRFVTEYVSPIFDRLWAHASQTPYVAGDYLVNQPEIDIKMRGMLIDWLVDVHWKFKLYPETLYLCVNLIDRFLACKANIAKGQLQLVGATCMLIAAKYEDIYAPEIKDIIHITDRAYKKEEILAMEVEILNTLQFAICSPSALLYLLRLGKLGRIDERQFFLAQYCLELALPNYSIWVRHPPAQLASSVLFLSNKLLRKSPGWPPALAEMTGFPEAQLKGIAKELCNVLQQVSAQDTLDTRAIKRKFSQAKYFNVAKMVL